jgi:hypothetical protein
MRLRSLRRRMRDAGRARASRLLNEDEALPSSVVIFV